MLYGYEIHVLTKNTEIEFIYKLDVFLDYENSVA